MFKTTGSFEKLALKAFKTSKNKVVRGDGGRADEMVVDLSKNEKSKKSTCMPNVGVMEEPNFLTPNAKKAFNYLWLAFIKAPIFQHFDLESHILIETDVLGYAIG